MQEIIRGAIKQIIYTFVIPGMFITANLIASENDMYKLLPAEIELGNNVTAEYQQKAEGEGLVELINGGAVLFFRHGFKQTIFQEYYIDSVKYINLEIYQMESTRGAKGIFLARTDTLDMKINLGQLGFRSNYYCSFYRDNYYIIATGSDSTEAIRSLLVSVAKTVDQKIIQNK